MSLLHHRELIALSPPVREITGDAAPAALRLLPLMDQALRLWAWAGVVALLLFPALRGSDPLLGWLPFWLLIWPLLSRGLLWLRFRRPR